MEMRSIDREKQRGVPHREGVEVNGDGNEQRVGGMNRNGNAKNCRER